MKVKGGRGGGEGREVDVEGVLGCIAHTLTLPVCTTYTQTRDMASSPILPLGLSLLYMFLLGQSMAAGLLDSIFSILTAIRVSVKVWGTLFVSRLLTFNVHTHIPCP